MPNQRVLDLISETAKRYGLDEDWLKRVVQIESAGNPSARTGSYKGLTQLSDEEFAAGGGRGSIYDPAANLNAYGNRAVNWRQQFQDRYGRDPTGPEAYMLGQQGVAGTFAHIDNPDQPAWKSMLSTGEGQQKGEAWAKRAIWGNIPDDMKAQFGNVNNVTSADFINRVWAPKFGEEHATGSPPGLPVQARDLPVTQTDMTAMGPKPVYAADVSLAGAKPSLQGVNLNFQLPSAESPLARLQSPGVTTLATPRLAALPATPSLYARYGR